MSAKLWWEIARASGLVAWALASFTVIWGLLLATRIGGRRARPRWLADLHQFLGGLTVVFTVVHVGALVADSYVHFGLSEILVPLASRWRPGPVALGVVSAYLLVAVELTSLARRHLPRRLWRTVHLGSYVLFWAATLHGLTAGTDASHPAVRLAVLAAVVVVVFLTVFRVLMAKGAGGPARGSAPRRPASPAPPQRAADELVGARFQPPARPVDPALDQPREPVGRRSR